MHINYQVVQKYRFAALVTASLGVHAWLLLGLAVDRPLPEVYEEQTIFLKLSRAEPDVPKVSSTPVIDEAPEAVAMDEETAPNLPPIRVEPVSEPPSLPEAAELKRELTAALSGRSAFEVFSRPSCTEVERVSGIRNCGPERDDSQDPRRQHSNATFAKDMDRVAALVARSDNLAALDPDDPVQASLLREQEALLREEIIRIDRQYAQFNLLKLIPIGKRAVKGLSERLGEG